jgi:hypothetical protein
MDRVIRPAPRLRAVLDALLAELGPELAKSDRPGFTLVASHGGETKHRFVPAIHGGHIIVGRHSQADLRLDGDPTLSLRHLLIRGVMLDDGTPALRILDLETPIGFGIEDGTPVRSIVVTGPFAIALGDWTLAGAPHGDRSAPPRVGEGPYRLPAPELHLSHQVPRRVVGDLRRSHITQLPKVAGLVNTTPPVPVARMTMRRRGREDVDIGLTKDQLAHGVLIGRYGRCIDGGVLKLVTDSVSRAHALILRTDGEDIIYDLASTQGTYLAGRRIRIATLSLGGARLKLGFEQPVELIWSPRLD